MYIFWFIKGQDKLVDAPSIIKAIRQTQQEREAARERARTEVVTVSSDDDVEMTPAVSITLSGIIKPVFWFSLVYTVKPL